MQLQRKIFEHNYVFLSCCHFQASIGINMIVAMVTAIIIGYYIGGHVFSDTSAVYFVVYLMNWVSPS
jgi:hypothetical protein